MVLELEELTNPEEKWVPVMQPKLTIISQRTASSCDFGIKNEEEEGDLSLACPFNKSRVKYV